MTYQILVRGLLDQQLAAWFGDCTIRHTGQGDSLLVCRACDQAALYGVLARCRDMGLTLLAVYSDLGLFAACGLAIVGGNMNKRGAGSDEGISLEPTVD
ncbi:MAG: hypothetical protein H6658_19200 [Ardenticatenaceae bacterium]|nr:hypothetical protein [Ardenticatenaceae bacterium]